ncbi:hypothetical protein THAOC_20163, partial [Thalassiosira oceanica]
MSVATEQSRRLRRIGRPLLDDADEARAPSWPPEPGPALGEEPSCGHGRDDVGLFMDICISICSDEVTDAREYSAGRLTACGGYNSDCTAETESSSSTGGSTRGSVAYSTINLPLCSDDVYTGETRETPPAPPPSPLRINIVYRDRSFNSELSILESTTLDAKESTAPAKTGKPNGSSSGRAPIDAARKGWALYKDDQTGKSYVVRSSTSDVESSSKGRWKEYIDYESGKSYFANGSTTTWERPLGVFVEPVPSPSATSHETGGKRASGST